MKTALVTGGVSGIGRSTAEALRDNGYRVIVADLNEPASPMDEIQFIQADLANTDACQHLINTVNEQHNGIDILVNNAGFQHVCPLEDFPLETWQTMQSVMLTAPFLLTRGVWPAMKAKGWGRIINIASIHGLVASLFKSSYITAKHGLIGFTKASALEGGEFGITANAICPGYVRTPLVERQIADQSRLLNLPEDRVIADVLLKNAAVKRLLTPEDIAAMVIYLCSPAADCVTGSSWSIDQGWTAQ
ncbi:3-hydroxybutyrate dehydrogenase [Endozoicomonas ascidiicola]|uniref:3-hydroxybutyrate dehydrogenase n=1 Tax=Endozoicomonas ascidiicola TaxID=1698521 RepID=UPI0008357861|nr:3-hydroxybutyrate dehydrogenase [Endozoicomonas ascidiicola]